MTMKRNRMVVSMLLVFCLIIAMIPGAVFAGTNAQGATEDNPIALTVGATKYFNFGWNANGERYGLGTTNPTDDYPYYSFMQYFSFKPSKTGIYDISVSNPYVGTPDKYGNYDSSGTYLYGNHYIKPDGTWGSDYSVFDLYGGIDEKTGKMSSKKAYLKSGYTYIIYVESYGLHNLFSDTHDYNWDDGREYYIAKTAEYKTFDWKMGIEISEDTELTNIKAPSIKSLSKVKKGFTVKWKKPYKNSENIDYEICYSTNKNFKKAQTYTYPITLQWDSSAYKKASIKINWLKSKKKYYVKVRTRINHYGYISGTDQYNFYSKWSKTKTVTTK